MLHALQPGSLGTLNCTHGDRLLQICVLWARALGCCILCIPRCSVVAIVVLIHQPFLHEQVRPGTAWVPTFRLLSFAVLQALAFVAVYAVK